MQLFQLLSTVEITHFGQTFDVALNWIGKIISALIGGVGIVGVGIILFSVILKIIVLPFDVYQRITMRKQNIKMKENQDKMEKLQKQYANNKEMYNQKVMEMYKENGISMFSSCLPMILSMIIFFVAIGAFNSYSQYANIQNYNILVNAYNEKIEEFAPDMATAENVSYGDGKIYVQEADKPLSIVIEAPTMEGQTTEALVNFANQTINYQMRNDEGNMIFAKYFVKDVEQTFVDLALETTEFYTQPEADDQITAAKATACSLYFRDQAQNAVVGAYEAEAKNNVSFLWIKNVWTTDAAYKHPVLPYEEFIQTMTSRSDKFDVNGNLVEFASITQHSSAYKEASYNEITMQMTAQKSQANGYFILVILSIGTILLQQFVSMRSQKEQNQYSSVDGQGAQTQKTTMIIMTMMFAIFSFMYSAAFSIYMITSNLLSLLSMLIINKIVDVSMNKKEAKALAAKYNRTIPGKNVENTATDKKKKK